MCYKHRVKLPLKVLQHRVIFCNFFEKVKHPFTVSQGIESYACVKIIENPLIISQQFAVFESIENAKTVLEFISSQRIISIDIKRSNFLWVYIETLRNISIFIKRRKIHWVDLKTMRVISIFLNRSNVHLFHLKTLNINLFLKRSLQSTDFYKI